MHTNRISLARKILARLAILAVLAFLAGCENVALTNLTPASMPENPSQIYTFTLRAAARSNTVSGITPRIIINGQNYAMTPSPLGQGLYDFEYRLSGNADQISYYYLVNYNVEGNSVSSQHEAYTSVEKAQIVRRYVLSLEVNRGPVGARVSVLGRGFTPQDTLTFSGTPVRTQFESPTSLSFYVPPLEPNRNYQVALSSVAGDSPVGTFRIDPNSVSVAPSSLILRTGERQMLTFTLPNAAPPGGTLLDVQTDVPESVIMPEVIVPQGQTVVTVTVEGGKAGNGSLYLKGYGAGEVTIPVTVTGR